MESSHWCPVSDMCCTAQFHRHVPRLCLGHEYWSCLSQGALSPNGGQCQRQNQGRPARSRRRYKPIQFGRFQSPATPSARRKRWADGPRHAGAGSAVCVGEIRITANRASRLSRGARADTSSISRAVAVADQPAGRRHRGRSSSARYGCAATRSRHNAHCPARRSSVGAARRRSWRARPSPSASRRRRSAPAPGGAGWASASPRPTIAAPPIAPHR